MSKKSKRRADVKSSILVLLLIAILLIASTYAWFTANTTVTISTLDVNVRAENGLQISSDGTHWKTILQNSDIDPTGDLGTDYAGNVNQIPTVMEPVSSVGEMATDGTMNMFYGTVTSNGTTGDLELKAVKETDTQGVGETAGKYIAFDTFLKVDETSQLTLTATSNVIAKAGTESKGLENAARVAFCVLGNTTAGDSLTNIQALNDGTSSPVYIWEPNFDVHTDAGISNAKDIYGKTTTKGPGAEQLPYYGVKAAISTPVDIASTDSNYFSTVTPAYKTAQTVEAQTIFTLQAGITKVRIYMWVEGQDVDCENTASGSDISFNVQFSIPAKT